MNTSRTSSVARTAVVSLLIAAGLAGAARGQCDAYRPGTFDFDQKRTTAPGIPGLPFDGVGHCIPSSWADNVAYMANHGAPEMTNNVVLNWNDPASYAAQTILINDIGALMGTDAGGTDTFGPGMIALINQRAPGKFLVGGKGYAPGDPCTPKDILEILQSGGFAAVVRATYVSETPGSAVFVRSTGHIMAVRHVYNACDQLSSELGLRNPSSADSTTAASVPAVYADQVSLGGRFIRTTDGPAEGRTLYIWDSTVTASKFGSLDCIEVVMPTFALGGQVVNGQEAGINIMRPVQLADPVRPVYPGPYLPPSGQIRAVHVDPSLAYFWVVGDGPNGGCTITKVGAGTLQPRLTIELEDVLITSAVSKKGQFYFGSGRTVSRLDLLNPTQPTMFVGLLPAVQKAIAIDDSTDSMIIVMEGPAGPSIARASLTPGSPLGPALPLPRGVQIDGEVSAITKVGAGTLVLSSSNVDAIFVLSPGAAGGWVLDETITLPAASHPRNLQSSDRGTILYTSGGVVVELERGAAGGYAPKLNSDFAGAVVGSVFALATSRNLNPEQTNVAGDRRNVVPELTDDRPDCIPDFNDDGNLDPDDLSDYIAAFFAAPAGLIADFNGDGRVDPDDLSDYISAFFGGC